MWYANKTFWTLSLVANLITIAVLRDIYFTLNVYILFQEIATTSVNLVLVALLVYDYRREKPRTTLLDEKLISATDEQSKTHESQR